MAEGVQITTRVSPYTIKRLARELGVEVQRVGKFSEELGKRLAETAAAYAQEKYEDAYYDGVNDVKVAVRKTKKGNYSVTASGTAVPFIEYGAGVHFGGGYPGDVPARYGGIGDYGQGHGNDDYWRFEYRDGVDTTAGGTVYEGMKIKKTTVTQLTASDREVSYTDNEYDEEGNLVYEPSGRKWVYTHGNPANACLYNAFQDLIEYDFDNIVDEVRDAKL